MNDLIAASPDIAAGRIVTATGLQIFEETEDEWSIEMLPVEARRATF